MGLMSDGGYTLVEPIEVLDAADFGVPQRRKRVFILGGRKGLELPRYPMSKGRPPTVWQAIGDLAVVEQCTSLEDADVYVGKLGKPSRYAQVMRGLERDPEDCSSRSVPHSSRLSGFRRTLHSTEVRRRFRKCPPGQTDPISRFIRLEKSGLSSTLRAGTGVERGSFMAPRPIHPVFPRCICLREAARLHSFPDWFAFHPAKWHGFMQIGNSVPPRLARAVAFEVARVLKRRG